MGEVTLSFGGVYLTLTPSGEDGAPSTSAELVSFKRSEKGNGDNDLVAELFQFSGTLRVSRSPWITPENISTEKDTSAISTPLISKVGPSNTSVEKELERKDSATLSSSLRAHMSLHAACSRPDVTSQELHDILRADPQAASTKNQSGQLPLHIIAQNETLVLSSPVWGHDSPIERFILELLSSYPAALSIEDTHGRMPFIHVLSKWTNDLHANSLVAKGSRSRGLNIFNQRTTPYGVPEASIHKADAGYLNMGELCEGPSPSTDPMSTSRVFPHHVETHPFLMWTLQFLSELVDHDSRMVEAEDTTEATRLRLMQTRSAVAENIASVPEFVKSVFLIEDRETRLRILSLPLIRRAFLSSQGVGVWFVAMLKQKGRLASRAVDYFELLSDVTIADFIGSERSPRQTDGDAFIWKRNEVFKAVGEYDEIIPALAVQETREKERAATTSIIQRMLDKAVSSPQVVSLILIDLALHLILMVAYRGLATQVEYIETDDDDIGGYREYSTTAVVVEIISLHFLFRKVTQMISLVMISRDVFWSFVKNFWNIIDICAIILTLGTMGWVQHVANLTLFSTILAVTMGLLWLKLLGFLKATNVHLATFILAVWQIMKDIVWFLVVMAVAIFMFADMMHIISHTVNGPESCAQANEDNGERVRHLEAADDYCAEDIKQAYLRTYGILIGDLSLDDFQDTPFVTFLFVVFTFLGIIVLLNVLIAMVSESWEKSTVMSERLFGRARVEFAAEHVSLQKAVFGVGNRFRCMYWLTVVSILVTTLMSDYYIVSVVYKIMKNNFEWGRIGLFIFLVVCAFGLNIAVIPFCLSLVGDFFRSTTHREFSDYSFWGFIRDFLSAPLWCVRDRLIVTTEKPVNWSDETEEEQAWSGRMDHIERLMQRTISESEARVNESINSSEERIRKNESVMKIEIQSAIGSLSSDVRHALGGVSVSPGPAT